MYSVIEGTLKDIGSWMKLVTCVRWNFPRLETDQGLEEYKSTVLRFMDQKRAVCVKEGDTA